MAKKKRKNSDKVSRSKVGLQAHKLLKFRSNETSVRTSTLYGNRPMVVSDRMNDWKISYVMTTHAIERMNERAMYETDIRNTLAFGASFRRYQEERDTYVYVYEYRCFRVVVDREVTTDMEEVVVITATYSYAFNDIVNRFESIILTSDWRMYRGLRLVYDELGSSIFEERSTERVKTLMVKRGYTLHNAYTLELRDKKKSFDFKQELGNGYEDYMCVVQKFNMGYAECRSDIEKGDFKSLCEYVGGGYKHVVVNERDYIIRNCVVNGKTFRTNKIEALLDKMTSYFMISDWMYALACGPRYNMTLGYCNKIAFVYSIEEVVRYVAEVDRYKLYAIDYDRFSESCNSYLSEKGFSIYDSRFTPTYEKDLANTARRRNLKLVHEEMHAQKELFEALGIEIG